MRRSLATISKVADWLGPDRSLTERIALFSAMAVVGPSFEPGLQPRRTVHQAVATGVISGVTLVTVTVSQSAIESIGRVVTRGRSDQASIARRALPGAAVNAGVAALSFGVAKLLPARSDESLRRGLARVVADRVAKTAVITTGASVLLAGLDLVERHVLRAGWLNHVPIAIPAGVGAATVHIIKVRREMVRVGDAPANAVSTLPSLALGAAVGSGVWVLHIGERALARVAGGAIRRYVPNLAPFSWTLGHAVSATLIGGVLYVGYEYVIRQAEQGGAAIEPAYEEPATSAFVSGGPGSAIAFADLSREGRRFVNMALTTAEIESVMGEPAVAEPVRVFVPLAAGVTVEERIGLALDELVRTGAFDREVLCVASPTGSGYINYVMSEALEYMTRGNSAIVTLQYSLRPSPLSLDRAATGVEQNRALLFAVTGYLRALPPERRPRLVLFGESLGALTILDTYHLRSVTAMIHDLVSGGLFLGSPEATRFMRSWRLDPDRIDPQGALVEVDNFAEYEQLSQEARRPFVVINHHDDPIPKFGASLIVRPPSWLGDIDDRPTGVPKSTQWRAMTTFVLTGIDLVNAMDVVPGVFTRRGHDYRSDIPAFVRTVYGLNATDAQCEAIETALRSREMHWAQQRVVTEQFARAKEAVVRELNAWGVADSVNSGQLLASVLEGMSNPRRG